MKPTKEMLEVGAFAAMVSNCCGFMVGDERVMCDDERLGEDKEERCRCREDFTAGLVAALSASPLRRPLDGWDHEAARIGRAAMDRMQALDLIDETTEDVDFVIEQIGKLALSASPAGPFEMRHEEGGYIEFLNEEVPTVVRKIDGRVAILTTLEQPRKVVGYRVYNPGSSPSEVFGSASPAGVKDIDEGRFETWTMADFAAQCRMQSREQLDPEFSRFMAALSAGIMSAIEPAGVTMTMQPLGEEFQAAIGDREGLYEPAGVGVETEAPEMNVVLTRALGMYGSAYDPVGVPLRAYTYEHQPGNGAAWRIGCAVSALSQHPRGGDPIDVGLYLLKEMQAQGFGVFEVTPLRAALTKEGEQ